MARVSHPLLAIFITLLSLASVHLQRCSKADIALVVDTSSSVFEAWDNPDGIKNFIREFIMSLPIGRDKTRLSVQIFADGTSVQWPLNAYFKSEDMANQVDSLYFRNNIQSYIGEAFNTARTTQFQSRGDRNDAPNMVVMLTDGAINFNISTIRQEIVLLVSEGIQVYVIGWGPANRTQMLELARTYPDNVYVALTYQDIVEDFQIIQRFICGDEVIEAPPDNRPSVTGPVRPNATPSPTDCSRADIAFMMDTSSSVKPVWNSQILAFLSGFIEQLNIGDNEARVSVSVFADGAQVAWFFNTYTRQQDILSNIDGLYFRDVPETQYEFAFNAAQSLQFVPQNGDRSNAPNIAILVTDGADETADDLVDLEADNLRNADTAVYVVGWGDLDVDVALKIAGNEARVFYATDATELVNNIDAVFKSICTLSNTQNPIPQPGPGVRPFPTPGPPGVIRPVPTPGPVPVPPRQPVPTDTPRPIPGPRPSGPSPAPLPRPRPDVSADILFLVDSSGSVNAVSFSQLQDFLSSLIQRILSTYDARTALALFSTRAQLAWDFNRYATSTVAEVSSAPYNLLNLGGATYTSTGLKLYSDELSSGKRGNRPNSRDIIILVSDGQTVYEDRPILYDSIPDVQRQATVLGVGVGPIDLEEMQRIVSPPFDLNYVEAQRFSSLAGAIPTVMAALRRSLDFTNELPPPTQLPIVTQRPIGGPVPQGTLRPPRPVPGPVVPGPGPAPPSDGEECVADIFILVDSSGSIRDAGQNNYNLLKNFISNVILGLPISENRIRIALGIFSAEARVLWDYEEYSSAPELVEAVNNIPYIGAETYTSEGIRLYLDSLKNQGGNRRDATDVIVLITDGNTTAEDRGDLKRVLPQVKSSARIMAVGIGDIDLTEIETIVSPPWQENYVGAEDFLRLINVLDQVISVTGCPVDNLPNRTIVRPVDPGNVQPVAPPPPPTQAPLPPPTQAPLPPPEPPTAAPVTQGPALPPNPPTIIVTPPEQNDATLAVQTCSVDNTDGSPGNFPFSVKRDFSDKFNIASDELTIPADGLYYFSLSAGAPANQTVDFSLEFDSLNLQPSVRRTHKTNPAPDTLSRDALFLLTRGTQVKARSERDMYSDAFKMTCMIAFSVSDTMLNPKYFYVYRRNGVTNSSTVEFTDILLNNQNDYVTTTNEYICPITAIYVFTFSVFVEPNQMVNARLRVGFDYYELARNHTNHGSEGGDVLSRTVLALCYTNMTVAVELVSGVTRGGTDLSTGFLGFSYTPDPSRTRNVYWMLRRNTEYINTAENIADLPFTEQDQPGYPFAEDNNGIFNSVRCPSSGWYYVYISAATRPNYPLNLFITVNDIRQVAVFRAARWHGSGMDYIGRAAIVKCREGNDIKVQIGPGTAVGNVLSSSPSVRGTSFLGFMIYSDDSVKTD